MTNMTSKTLFRTIRSTFGRYAAILAIVALGVGFFMGLKNAQPAMQTTADEYLDDLNMYDFQLISTLGLTSGDIEAFSEIDGIEDAEGGWRLDVLANSDSGETVAYQALSMPDRIAIPKLVYGRMPQDEDECVVDASVFSPEDVGKVLTLSEGNDSSTLEQLKYTEYKIVGLVNSPRFISNDRGSTSLGGGTVAGFLYLSKDAFDSDVYHEALLSGAEDLMVFSDEYDDRIEIMSSRVEDVLQERALMRYNEIKSDAQQQISEARAELEDGQAQYDQAISSGVPEELLSDSIAELKQAQREIDEAEDELSELEEPETYVLDLDSNSGCASFENDIAIVDGIANAFPIFFVLIAALVCVTTMTRMVNDERTQIGTLKALGYSEVVISLKYIIYASSAAVIGCVAGFFIGTGVIPQIIWEVYDIRYGFTTLVYYFDPVMYGWCLAVSIFGSIGVTMFACHRELIEKPAELIRPKAPVNGKRIFLEKIRPLWNRLSFLNKVTLRNAFRYKKRMVMMLLGIGGCTALIVTGFGLRDSIANILNYQYDEIMLYDAAVSFDSGEISESEIDTLLSDRNVEHILGYQEDMLVSSEKN